MNTSRTPCSSTDFHWFIQSCKKGHPDAESTVTLPQSYLISKCAPAEGSNFNPYSSTEIDSSKFVLISGG